MWLRGGEGEKRETKQSPRYPTTPPLSAARPASSFSSSSPHYHRPPRDVASGSICVFLVFPLPKSFTVEPSLSVRVWLSLAVSSCLSGLRLPVFVFRGRGEDQAATEANRRGSGERREKRDSARKKEGEREREAVDPPYLFQQALRLTVVACARHCLFPRRPLRGAPSPLSLFLASLLHSSFLVVVNSLLSLDLGEFSYECFASRGPLS